MEIVIKIAALTVIASVLSVVLKKDSPEISFMLIAAAVCIAIFCLSDILSEMIGFLLGVTEDAGVPAAIPAAMLKTAGIAVIARLAADMCKDSGQQAAATAVELAGGVSALYVALPLISAMFEMINSFW